IDVPFLVFALLAWQAPSRLERAPHPAPGFVRFVRSGSPLLLALAVLIVAILLLRTRFNLGVAGVVVAVLGYGLRSILSQVRQSEAEEELRNDHLALVELAMRDSLTGVPNRRAFEEALAREWRVATRTQHPISLLLIDVDFFKQYNDRYGHPAGDDCLRHIAAVLQQALQRPTDILARYGGEEFALILPDTPQHGAKDVATRLCSSVRLLDIPHEGADTHKVTISIGVASTTPANGGTPEELVAAADQALYRAKHNGRNRVEQAD
ncbi:MAG TPA: diguanylate cyclase, partial [Dyella sp.]|nr:diguanylate cyclase [Dyella sp.]